MKTKKQIYEGLSKEIVESRKIDKRTNQTILIVIISTLLMVAISILSNNEDERFVFCAVILLGCFLIYRKLPFGEIEEPTIEEVLEFAKKKYTAATTKKDDLDDEIEELKIFIHKFFDNF